MLYFINKEDGSSWLQPLQGRQHSEGNRGDFPGQEDIRHPGRPRATNALRDGRDYLNIFPAQRSLRSRRAG